MNATSSPPHFPWEISQFFRVGKGVILDYNTYRHSTGHLLLFYLPFTVLDALLLLFYIPFTVPDASQGAHQLLLIIILFYIFFLPFSDYWLQSYCRFKYKRLPALFVHIWSQTFVL
jgi:hypothetical protein